MILACHCLNEPIHRVRQRCFNPFHSLLEWYKNDVNYKSVHDPGGLERLTTLDGYVIPLVIKDVLACLNIWPRTDHEYEILPHVFFTSELEWDPNGLGHDFTDEAQ
jgi:hypothetical protein